MNRTTFGRALLLAGAMGLIAGGMACSKKKDNPTTTTAAAPTTFDGTWSGGITTSAADPGGCGGAHAKSTTIKFVLTQSGTSITGTVQTGTGAAASTTGTVSGTTAAINIGATTCGGTGTSAPVGNLTLGGALTFSGTSCEPCTAGTPSTETPWTLSGSGTMTKS